MEAYESPQSMWHVEIQVWLYKMAKGFAYTDCPRVGFWRKLYIMDVTEEMNKRQ